MTTETEFCLLGPLTVRSGQVLVALPRGKQRAVLAALLLNANQVVSVDELIETLWGHCPPPSARVTVQNNVMRLRKTLGDTDGSRISTHPHGYLIRVAAGELDVTRFEDLLGAARTAARGSSWDAAAAQARAALSLWRGEPLADVDSDLLELREGPRLAELRLQALEARIDADLHLGRHAEVIIELRQLAGAHPLREHLDALLMLALHRDGRQAEALAAYQHARRVLIDELGTEPGTTLRELHQRILTGDPALAAPEPGPPATGGPGPAVPRELPPAVRHFTGRAGELQTLTRLLDESGGQTSGTVVISAIGGTAGVGKTALALHWAHQVADRFPGGQLYVNLRGYGPSAAPAAPAAAIRGFLDALGVPPERIPLGLDAQAGLYRSLLADRKMLIVLDNAADEQQVRPLLPAGPECVVIVTSRSQLAGLAAAHGAWLLTLDVFSPAEAQRMLAARVGADRAAAEPEAIIEIAGLCACLPLALAVAAARAAARPGFPLAALAAELRDAHGRLDALDAGDPGSSVRAVFSWSVRQLGPATARMFRLLGLHPGPDITAPAAASLAGCGYAGARRLLRELTSVCLLTEHSPGRYASHDLLRTYAAEQAQATDDDADRHAATGRMLDHYLHTAHAAALLLQPSREPVALAPPRPGVTPEQPSGYDQALRWFEAEHHVLASAVPLAAGTGFDACAWQIPWAMSGYLDRRGHWQEWAATQRTGLDAAARVGDTAAHAVSRRLLADACVRLGDYDEARTQLMASLDLYRELGDRVGEARTHQNLCQVDESQDRPADALGRTEQALRLYRATGHQRGEASSLNNVGWYHALLGNYDQTRSYCRQALALSRKTGHRKVEAHAWDSIGYAEHHLGRHDEAATCYLHALNLFRELGDLYYEADALRHLGDAQHAAGELRQARDAWRQALAILDDLNHPDAHQVRARLAVRSASRPSGAQRPAGAGPNGGTVR
jgi:DNA-binding SARP family transcriptional activator